LRNNIHRPPIPILTNRRVIPAPRSRRLIPVRDTADQVVRRHPNKRPSHPRLAPRWLGNPGTGAGADTAGCGCPAVMSPARTRAPIGFLVTGPNDTGAGFGCRDTGDDIRPSADRDWPVTAAAASCAAYPGCGGILSPRSDAGKQRAWRSVSPRRRRPGANRRAERRRSRPRVTGGRPRLPDPR